MVNGMLQCLSTGLIPGNRNIDDVDPAFRRFDRLFYPNVYPEKYKKGGTDLSNK